ncbi:MAG: F0F1 ATP synthase subunit B [Clostridium sp.]
MELEWSKVIWTIINFLILFFILKHFFFSKIEKILEDREKFILSKINSANEKEKKADELLEEREKLIYEAKIEGKQIVEKRKLQGDIIYEELMEKARVNVRELGEKGKKELELSKEKAREELKEETITVAISLSEKILEKNLDDEEQKKLIDNFIKEFEV